MDAPGRRSERGDDYWQSRYFEVVAQNKRLREENESLKDELTSTRSELADTQRMLEETSRASASSHNDVPVPHLSDTLELSHTNVKYMLSLVCTSQSSINLSLSNLFEPHNFKSSFADTINQRSKDTLDPHSTDLFRIESVGEREEDSIEVLDSQSSTDKMYEEFMVIGLSAYSKTTDNPAEVLMQYPNREFVRGS